MSVEDLPSELIGRGLQDYIYEPLRDGEIRLFHMDASKLLSDQITGTLQAMPLPVSMSPPLRCYTALSYAWGPSFTDGSHLTEYIVCDGCRLKVTPNLKQALRRIRQLESVPMSIPPSSRRETFHPPPRTNLLALWIDALCINQADSIERSCNVKMMDRIFRSSVEMVIWLNELSPGDLGEMQHHLLCSDSEIVRNGRLQCPRCENDMDTSPGRVLTGDPVLGKRKRASSLRRISTSSLTDEDVFASILARPWFRRRWVVQEVLQAPSNSTYILLGDVVCHKNKFLAISEQVKADSRPIASRATADGGLSALFYYDQSECSNPRDYIYALLSEFSLSERARMEVDYEQDVRTTYLNLVKSTALHSPAQADEHDTYEPIYRYEPLIVYLAVASCKKSASSQSSMEAWVPDWRLETRFETDIHRATVKDVVNESLQPSWGFRIDIELRVDNNEHHYLEISGMLLKPYYGEPEFNLDRLKIYQCMRAARDASRADRELQIQPMDRIWLTGHEWYGEAGSLDGWNKAAKSLAFLLRRHPSIPLFREKPVYIVHSCFPFKIEKDLHNAQSESPELKEDLTKRGILLDAEFYLG